MAWRNHRTGLPLVTPLYYEDTADGAYECRQAYRFGTQLLAAPFTAPRDPDTRFAAQSIYLPRGEWFDFWTGARYAGGRWRTFYGGLDDIPVLARAGALVPLDFGDGLTLRIFPGADGEFELYEDDGETLDYAAGRCARTTFSAGWANDEAWVELHPAVGDTSVLTPCGDADAAQRAYRLQFVGVRAAGALVLEVNGAGQPLAGAYDAEAHAFALAPITLGPRDRARVSLRGVVREDDGLLPALRRMLRVFRLESCTKARIDRDLPALVAQPALFARYTPHLKDAHIAALVRVIEENR
jgi:hypothetical protein